MTAIDRVAANQGWSLRGIPLYPKPRASVNKTFPYQWEKSVGFTLFLHACQQNTQALTYIIILSLVVPPLHYMRHIHTILYIISLCMGGSKVPVVTVNVLQNQTLSEGRVFPFDV